MTTAPLLGSAETRATLWLVLALLALPWLGTLEWDFDRSAVLALLAVPILAGHAAIGRALSRLPHVSVRWRACAAALLVVALGATTMSSHPAASLVQLAAWTMVTLAAILAGQLVHENQRHADVLLGALTLSAAIATAIHWAKWQSGAPPQFAFYTHPRLMGLHALSGALAGTALVVAGRHTAVWLVIGAVAWGGLLWTGSRSPLLGIAAAVVVWLVRGNAIVRRRLVYAVACHALFGLALATLFRADAPTLGWSSLVERTAAAETTQQLTSNRSEFWAQAWTHVWRSPWLGHGPDSYRFLQPKLEGNQPHNVALQWLLDFGPFGALLAAVLAALGIVRACRHLQAADALAGLSAITIASVVAGQLDGYFYHLYALLPAAISFGVAALARPAPMQPVSDRGFVRRLWPAGAALAASLLVVHTWVFDRAALSRPPRPDDLVARVWHAFPSTTLRIDRWIDDWERTQPEAALRAARIAAAQSPNADFFHVKIAGILLRRGDLAGARAELATALTIAPPSLRPVIAQLQAQLSAENTGR